jgi:hypothetical protein
MGFVDALLGGWRLVFACFSCDCLLVMSLDHHFGVVAALCRFFCSWLIQLGSCLPLLAFWMFGYCPYMRDVHAIRMWDPVPFLFLFADRHMAFVASSWEHVPIDLGYCSASSSCYGLFKGACSL